MEGVPRQFASPEEEIAFLRQQIAAKERELLTRAPEADHAEIETVGKEQLHEYGTFTPKAVLTQEHQMTSEEVSGHAEQVSLSKDPVEDVIAIAQERGIHNALSVLERSSTPFTTDEVHRRLIELIKEGKVVGQLREGVPPWQILHMTLFEVTLPEIRRADGEKHQLKEIFGLMDQFFSGMQGVGYKKKGEHYVLEIASPEGSDHIIFYVSVPNEYIDLFHKQILSLYPDAVITEQQHDYNIFVEGGTSLVAVANLKKHPVYPIRSKDTFDSDPFAVLLNAFSKIEKEGGGAALQVIVNNPTAPHFATYESIVKQVRDGMKPKEAIERSTIGGNMWASVKDSFFTKKKEDEPDHWSAKEVDQDALEVMGEKLRSPIVETNIRIAVSARTEARAKQILAEIEATFNQFEHTRGNKLTFTLLSGSAAKAEIKAFSFREFLKKRLVALSLIELSTLIHFPADGINTSPEFKQSQAKTAAAPAEIPTEGTLLGTNSHRGITRDVYITPEDRLRHFYIIGQTGTGKTSLMKNMIIQDIEQGAGVCMIDPHGTDIEDVMAAIPPEREDDLIYFDPARMDRVVGFNMLEYDPYKPEQKTFVVNELFSIFQKLYGKTPESMGPIFEQYFRNATMLVMDDPDSGNTLMDVSRVMADARYRRMKLEKATNPVVVQFWREIATKAGGEAALENIVPYITSKFDVFTANDYMRPIIGQQHSAFDFRKVMDERKILLVNLSKGRLGEINANLIGMIMVGKILMAALSRVDDPTKGFAPFYLHMDEFQNVSTSSIAAILSEARKYKLGLTVAHQFIAQLDEDIKDAVFGNVGSISAFRVGPEDAKSLEHQFAPTFDANDLMNVPNHNAYVRLLANGTPTRPFSIATKAPREPDPGRVALLIEKSYRRYGRSREEVEAEIRQRYQKEPLQMSGGLGMM